MIRAGPEATLSADSVRAAATDARGRLLAAVELLRGRSADALEAQLAEAAGSLLLIATDREPPHAWLPMVLVELSGALRDLQDAAPAHPELEGIAETVAHTMATLYPIWKQLQAEDRDAPAMPLTRKRRRSGATGDPPDTPQRRAAERLEVSAHVGFQTESNFFTGCSEDLSAAGLFIATYATLNVGTELTVSMVLPDGHQVTASGRVAWVREPRDRAELSPGVGVRFDALTPDDEAAIVGFMRRRPPSFYDI